VAICLALSLLLDWPWIAGHWCRQALVIIMITTLLAMGGKIVYANLFRFRESKTPNSKP